MSEGLCVEDLRVARGGKAVIHGINLELRPGRITALLGPNGAGKSTLVLTMAGALPATGGKILLDGRPIIGLRPERVRQLGVAAVPEGHRVLTDLTVEENLRVAGNRLDKASLVQAMEEAIGTFPELREKLRLKAGHLSGGQQQMLVLAQAIIGRPRYLLADELSFGLAPVIVARLVPVIAQLAEKGIGVLLIEQFTTVALQLAHEVHVMERGRIRFSGSSEELRRNPDILHSAYLAGGNRQSGAAGNSEGTEKSKAAAASQIGALAGSVADRDSQTSAELKVVASPDRQNQTSARATTGAPVFDGSSD